MAIDVYIAQSLTLAKEFREHCPRILLGMDGGDALEKMIVNLELFTKIQVDRDDINQYQLLTNIVDHNKKLKEHIDHHIPTSEDELQRMMIEEHADYQTERETFLADNFPYLKETENFRKTPHYQQLDTILQNLTTLQESDYTCLHAAQRLINSLHELQRFDSNEFGAIHNLLLSLQKILLEKNMPADNKLSMMAEEVHLAKQAVSTMQTGITIKLFGAKPKPNELTVAFGSFIDHDMPELVKPLSDQHRASKTFSK